MFGHKRKAGRRGSTGMFVPALRLHKTMRAPHTKGDNAPAVCSARSAQLASPVGFERRPTDQMAMMLGWLKEARQPQEPRVDDASSDGEGGERTESPALGARTNNNNNKRDPPAPAPAPAKTVFVKSPALVLRRVMQRVSPQPKRRPSQSPGSPRRMSADDGESLPPPPPDTGPRDNDDDEEGRAEGEEEEKESVPPPPPSARLSRKGTRERFLEELEELGEQAMGCVGEEGEDEGDEGEGAEKDAPPENERAVEGAEEKAREQRQSSVPQPVFVPPSPRKPPHGLALHGLQPDTPHAPHEVHSAHYHRQLSPVAFEHYNLRSHSSGSGSSGPSAMASSALASSAMGSSGGSGGLSFGDLEALANPAFLDLPLRPRSTQHRRRPSGEAGGGFVQYRRIRANSMPSSQTYTDALDQHPIMSPVPPEVGLRDPHAAKSVVGVGREEGGLDEAARREMEELRRLSIRSVNAFRLGGGGHAADDDGAAGSPVACWS